MYRVTCAAAALALPLALARGVADEGGRLAAAARVVRETRSEIPEDYWTKARCVAVAPDLKKAAFIVGGEYGKGAMSCRSGDSWSAPLFIQIAKGSWGIQAGAEQIDLVILVMNESGVEKLLGAKVTLGADASVAAGPVGRRAGADTDAGFSAEMLTYARSSGLFAGVDISGGVLRPDDDANQATYGRSANPRTILASRELSAPPEAAGFLHALGGGSSTATAPPTPGSASPRAPERRSAARASLPDDDVRAQLVDVQQALDRILADTVPSPVGTSGTPAERGRGTVVVERARLIQLRQQIESIIVSLNRR
jgi:lipid-binding SYLF domain-containing protein